MNCDWYEAQLANDGTELWRNGRPSTALLEHARACAVCDRTVERELKLKLMFTELAEHARAAEPSASVKHNLLAELQTRRPQKAPGFGWIPRFAVAAAVIACLVLALLYARRSQVSDTHNHLAKSPAQQAAPAVEAPSVQQPAPVVQQATNKKSMVRKPAPRQRDSAQAETANDFYPMVMCDSITCAGPAVTVRVELPASQFSARRSSGRKIMADLLVGDDGLVRGVRLLQ